MGTYKGNFSPKNPKKYKGDSQNIVFRSSWELRFMQRIDQDPSILEWASEEVIILYKNPQTGQYKRYFPDFWLKIRNKYGQEEILIVEIKPYKQTLPPDTKKRKSKKHLHEVLTYAINQSKWEAAKQFCKKKGWKFEIFTEHDLGIKR